jgi:hypothetical protein
MKFECRIFLQDRTWIAEHASENVGPIQVKAASREEVLQKLEREIRYWLELCPCSGPTVAALEIELVFNLAEKTNVP